MPVVSMASTYDESPAQPAPELPLHPLPQDDMPAEDFWREISILRTCRHDNIVQFKVS